jgi:hypothetical protein
MKHQMSRSQLRRYQSYLRTEEHSEATIRKYIQGVSAFCAFLPEDKAVSKDRVLEWKEHLMGRFAGTTVNVMLSASTVFYASWGWTDCRVKTVRLQAGCTGMGRELTRASISGLSGAAEKIGQPRLYYLLRPWGAGHPGVGAVVHHGGGHQQGTPQ